MGCDAKADDDGRFALMVTVRSDKNLTEVKRVIEFKNLTPNAEIDIEVIHGTER